ncbi:MAG: hypothetical protein F6K26_13400 [Moorea sp. SIO2I5]|nr:hypothetical protein [Moorena sp. SIO2I5]
MNFSAINSIIVVVDLAQAAQPGRVQNPTDLNKFWKTRARYHVEQWSETALDAIFGLVTSDSMKYVCLFINKGDLLPELKQQEIINEYQELIDKIVLRCKGLKFDFLVGSAKKGTAVSDLKKALRDHSVSFRDDSVSGS